MKWILRIILLGLGLAVLAGSLLLIPAVRERLAWHANSWYIQLKYRFNPPEEVVFIPGSGEEKGSTPLPIVPTETHVLPTITPNIEPGLPTATPEPSPSPLPASMNLQGVRYIDQHGLYNYCAPANLAMALSFWGWSGTRIDVGKVVKPFEKDKNVMPYEMADYVAQQTQLAVIQRSGGSTALLKALIASGFPVLVEKGAYLEDLTSKVSWMGHYTVVTGYDDAAQQFMTQDSFFQADYPVSYADFISNWRAFNYLFLVVYSHEKEAELMRALGPYADEMGAFNLALDQSAKEIYTTDSNAQFFAMYNRGTSLVNLQDYTGAAEAYDQAFQLYAKLAVDKRPWRMVWYQTGPYYAYFFSGRYKDVERLATQTIEAASEPYIEESWLWRARARKALGDSDGAVADLHKSLEYHPGFAPSLAELNSLGVVP